MEDERIGKTKVLLPSETDWNLLQPDPSNGLNRSYYPYPAGSKRNQNESPPLTLRNSRVVTKGDGLSDKTFENIPAESIGHKEHRSSSRQSKVLEPRSPKPKPPGLKTFETLPLIFKSNSESHTDQQKSLEKTQGKVIHEKQEHGKPPDAQSLEDNDKYNTKSRCFCIKRKTRLCFICMFILKIICMIASIVAFMAYANNKIDRLEKKVDKLEESLKLKKRKEIMNLKINFDVFPLDCDGNCYVPWHNINSSFITVTDKGKKLKAKTNGYFSIFGYFNFDSRESNDSLPVTIHVGSSTNVKISQIVEIIPPRVRKTVWFKTDFDLSCDDDFFVEVQGINFIYKAGNVNQIKIEARINDT